jgi:hypothetical protein
VPAAPAAPVRKNARGRNRRLRRNHSGLPCANGFNGFLRALLGDRAFLPPSSCRAPRITARLGSARHPQHLAPASGRQDHTTSPSALHLSPKPFDQPGTGPPEPWRRRMKVPLVLRARIAHGKTALRSKAHATLSRPSHPKPNVRDDAYVPLAGSGQRRGRPDWEEKERNLFLRGGLDEANQVETPQREGDFSDGEPIVRGRLRKNCA